MMVTHTSSSFKSLKIFVTKCGRFRQDIIISGGENISSLEVESIMMKHEKIAEVAVVARRVFPRNSVKNLLPIIHTFNLGHFKGLQNHTFFDFGFTSTILNNTRTRDFWLAISMAISGQMRSGAKRLWPGLFAEMV